MRCDVCGQEYQGIHNCAGVPTAITRVDGERPSAGSGPLCYLGLAIKIAPWDRVAMRRTAVRRSAGHERAQYAGAVLRLLKSIESEGTQKYSLISARGSNSIVPVVVHGAVNTFGSMTLSENSSNP